MCKIHVIQQFFEASGPQGIFLKKTKNTFYGSMCTKFQVCIVFCLTRDMTQMDTTNLKVKIGISPTACSPHVDFGSCFRKFRSFDDMFFPTSGLWK